MARSHQAAWLLLLAGLLLEAKALEFEGLAGQWARYSRWDAGGASGKLSFLLKTNVSRALVLYLDDGGDCDFLEVLIADGRLQLRFTIHCAEPASLHMETHVDDLRWHRVSLARNHKETRMAVDNEDKVTEVKSRRSEMSVTSDLYVGGISPDVRLSALTSSTVKYELPFRGLIANMKLGELLPVLLDGQGFRTDLEYLCAAHAPCNNRGLCFVDQGEVLCNCTNTGHKGTYCHEGERNIYLVHLHVQCQNIMDRD